ncbi:LacI family DNA-binding transcriptional regulator [Alteribacillus sp. YIM 98480]|uniref:LacI family DNA-binding transcriptional regulator n=1 Tax=Alteribacillus sp. YIM 98480 TaxID=2606599 RepID=UPI00131BA288|nr:substrate-binding domain-containing protein [Alteribacillus sp. YIM 98480]
MNTSKNITISDVAKHAKVSKSTVSQYLNQRFEYMGAATRTKIEESIKELGYSPNFLARSLKQKKTFTIGIIVANILHGFSTQVIRAIEDCCNEQDVHVIVCNADDDPAKEKKYISMLQAKQVDGFIIFPTGENTDVYKQVLGRNIPIVFVDRLIPDLEVDTLLLDNINASKLGVYNFVENGHEDIAIITPPLNPLITPRWERLEGYKEAMAECKKSYPEEYIISGQLHTLHDQLDKVFQLKRRPTAILCSNDLTLMEVLKYCKAKSILLPDQLSIIGIDEVSFATVYNPALSTIKQPAFNIGGRAAELLLDHINGKSSERKVYRYAPEFLERTSVKTL